MKGISVLDIYVDADGCPVKDEVYRVAKRHGLKVFVVSNAILRAPAADWVQVVVAKGGLDAADDWIAEHIQADDIAITGDIPLADRCLKKGARVLGPKGRVFTPESIGEAVSTRALMDQLRQTGMVTGGPAPFARQDRSRFLERLDALIHAIRRSQPK